MPRCNYIKTPFPPENTKICFSTGRFSLKSFHRKHFSVGNIPTEVLTPQCTQTIGGCLGSALSEIVRLDVNIQGYPQRMQHQRRLYIEIFFQSKGIATFQSRYLCSTYCLLTFASIIQKLNKKSRKNSLVYGSLRSSLKSHFLWVILYVDIQSSVKEEFVVFYF